MTYSLHNLRRAGKYLDLSMSAKFQWFFERQLLHYLRIDYYVQKIGGLRSQFSSNEYLAPIAIEKNQNPGGHFWRYLLNSTANPAHLPQIWTKWAELAVQFNW